MSIAFNAPMLAVKDTHRELTQIEQMSKQLLLKDVFNFAQNESLSK